MLSDKAVYETQLTSPNIQDKGAVQQQLRRINHQIETQTPQPYKGEDLDKAVRREKELRQKLSESMPSHEEMRKCPPGAVGKEMEFQKRHKKDVLEWKEIRLRLNPDTDDPDIANLERYRPERSTLNMDNAVIPGKQYYFPSEPYKENYDNIDWEKKTETPERPKKAKRKTKSKSKGWTPERREAQRLVMQKLHEKRREAKS